VAVIVFFFSFFSVAVTVRVYPRLSFLITEKLGEHDADTVLRELDSVLVTSTRRYVLLLLLQYCLLRLGRMAVAARISSLCVCARVPFVL